MKLSNLDTYIPTVGHDITKFDVHVKTLIQLLLAVGEISTDLLANIFKKYKMISYQEFIKYIKTKENNF